MYGFNDDLSKGGAISSDALKVFRVTNVSFAENSYDAGQYFTIPDPAQFGADIPILVGVVMENQSGNVLYQNELHTGEYYSTNFCGVTLYMQKNSDNSFSCAIHRFGNDTRTRTFSAINFVILYAER